MSVNTLSQSIEVDAVADVQVTTVVEADGRYARRIRLYGAPYAPGDLPVLDVLMRADDPEPLKFTVPESQF